MPKCAVDAGVLFLFAISVAIGGLPSLTQQEVIRIADAYARKKGVDLRHFKRPTVGHHQSGIENYWTAYYIPIPSKKGYVVADSDFLIRVDGMSRTASDDPLR